MDRVAIFNFAYEPIYFANWQDAVSDVYSGRAEVIEEHETLRIGVMDGDTLSSIALPKVVRFKTGIPNAKLYEKKKVKFNRNDLYARDGGKCQYCSVHLQKDHWTMDHIFPSSKGGETSWENCVVSCMQCNSKKGNKLLSETNMILLSIPSIPKIANALFSRKK